MANHIHHPLPRRSSFPWLAQVDAPSDLVAWIRSLGVSESAEAKLLQRLTGDEFGATGVDDLLELEPDDIDTLKATLPKLKRAAFVRALAALKVALTLSLTSKEHISSLMF